MTQPQAHQIASNSRNRILLLQIHSPTKNLPGSSSTLPSKTRQKTSTCEGLCLTSAQASYAQHLFLNNLLCFVLLFSLPTVTQEASSGISRIYLVREQVALDFENFDRPYLLLRCQPNQRQVSHLLVQPETVVFDNINRPATTITENYNDHYQEVQRVSSDRATNIVKSSHPTSIFVSLSTKGKQAVYPHEPTSRVYDVKSASPGLSIPPGTATLPDSFIL